MSSKNISKDIRSTSDKPPYFYLQELTATRRHLSDLHTITKRTPVFNFISHFLTIILLFGACKPESTAPQPPSNPTAQTGQATKQPPQEDADTTPSNQKSIDPRIAQIAEKYIPLKKVSQAKLNTKLFKLTKPRVTMQKYVDFDTPQITIQIPLQADYVEIMRCPESAPMLPPGTTLSLEQLEESNTPLDTYEKMMLNHDYWRDALSKKGCLVIHLGSPTKITPDPYAPSGSFKYLARPCIVKERLDFDSKATWGNETCSRMVSISNIIRDYTNKRKQAAQRMLRAASVMLAKIEQTTVKVRIVAEEAVSQLDTCAKSNQEAAIATSIRKSWITMAAVVGELGVEFVSITDNLSQINLKEVVKYYGSTLTGQKYKGNNSNWFNQIMDITQLGAAFQGFLFANTLNDVFTSAEDMKKTCTSYDGSIRSIEILNQELANYTLKYFYHRAAAQLSLEELEALLGEQRPELPPDTSVSELEQQFGSGQ